MRKKKKGNVVKVLSPENYIRQKARTLPVHQCHVNYDWKFSSLATVIVARKHTTGNFTVGLFLVDLGCQGVKDVQYLFNVYPHVYHDIYTNRNPMIFEPVSYVLAHNIIYTGLEFAEDYGFKPHRDFEVAKYILEEDTDEIEFIDIVCGHNGKPFYIREPDDSDRRVAEIIAQLEKTAGVGNFEVVLNDEEDELSDALDDDWEEDSEIEPGTGVENIDKELFDEMLAKMVLDEDFTLEDDLKLEFEDRDIQNSNNFQFKIQLKNIKKPPVWRRVLVPSYYNFMHLHKVIQVAFGWEDYHLFQFSEKGYGSENVITRVSDEVDAGFEVQEDAEAMLLSDVFNKEQQTYIYIYDFGDSWEHLITLEKIVPEVSTSAKLMDGKGACPPEDCGGPGGYEQLKIILADKSHPEHREYKEWLGMEEDGHWDPNELDIKEIQQEFDDFFVI